MSPAPTKGPVSQRELLPTMKALIDAAMAANSTAHKDIARSRLRTLLEVTNWRTPWIWNNLASRRCRYIASMGYAVPSRWMLRENRHLIAENNDDE